MAMKKCPDCGEYYSDTYEKCPFCEEEKALQEGKPIHRTTGSSKQFRLITPTLVVLIVIIGGLLAYLLFGSHHKNQEDPFEEPPIEEEVQEPEETKPAEEETEKPDKPEKPDHKDDKDEKEPEEHQALPVKPEKPDKPEKPEKPQDSKPKPHKPHSVKGYQEAMKLPDGLKMSRTDFTVQIVGEVDTIEVSGGNGPYKWYSEDPRIGSVDQHGHVTARSKGTVKIVATDGKKKGVCIVRMKLNGSLPPEDSAAKPIPAGAKLSKEDYTTSVGDPTVKLTVTGLSGHASWSTTDPTVATVSADGVVKAVGSGTTTVTATIDGVTLTCIVRVK